MKVTFRKNDGEVYFRSEKHKERFVSAVQEIDRIHEGDHIYGEYACALYALTSHLDIWDQASQYISRDGIKFPKLIQEEHFSSTRLELIKLATNLFNERMPFEDGTIIPRPDMYQIICLEESMFKVAVEAIRIRYYGLKLNDLEDTQTQK